MTTQIHRPPFCVLLLVFASLLCGFLPSAGAQSRGAIGGTVTDQAGAVLQGAQISTLSPALTVSTNEEGRFYINDLAPGGYNLTITYVGLAPFTTMVSVNAGHTANVDAQLRVANRGETVVVTAGRASAEAEAINVERAADNLLQVMPTRLDGMASNLIWPTPGSSEGRFTPSTVVLVRRGSVLQMPCRQALWTAKSKIIHIAEGRNVSIPRVTSTDSFDLTARLPFPGCECIRGS